MKLPKCSTLLALAAAVIGGAPALAEPLNCAFGNYKAAPGLVAETTSGALTVTWDGDPGQQVRLSLGLDSGAPVIREIAIKMEAGPWTALATNAKPDFAVMTGLRRMSNQQLQPLYGLGVKITQEVLNKYRWDAFWDAPFDMMPSTFRGNPPPAEGLPGTDQPGVPRDPMEVARAEAQYAIKSCDVTTNGGRIEVSLPGVQLGLFDGKLQYTIYRGSNMIRQEIIASTKTNWVAYKYDAGLKGLAIEPESRIAWRDTSSTWQAYRFGGSINAGKVPLEAANRVAIAENAAGSIAAFPPPHKFFWAREVAINMGYNWYRKDSDSTYGFGIRQNEHEEDREAQENWALYSARPGTQQLMPVYLYPALKSADQAAANVLAFTHGDTFKPVAGYQVLNHHYHMDLGDRLLRSGSLDTKLPDLVALKAVGINIVSQIDSVFLRGFSDTGAAIAPPPVPAAPAGPPPGPIRRGPRFDQIAITAASVAGARIHSDKGFLIMASQEVFGSPLGGHTDLLFRHPVYWDQRKPGQAFEEPDAKYGKLYHVGDAADFMSMVKAEDVMVSMPHPRTKGSTGFPDAVKDTDYFNDRHYQGFGLRWGMGLDGSEVRTCEYRCLPLLDDISNWVADRDEPLKYATSISEVRWQSPGDDIYASAPVTYLHLGKLPPPEDPSPVIDALMAGDSYITTGEVLLSNYAVDDAGTKSKIAADLEWTFPLDMVEIVWGDGKITGRKVIPTTELPPFGSHHFEIPFDATGKKWVRFAAWDSASEGAMTQPVRLNLKKR